MRNGNERAVLGELRRAGGLSRAELGRRTGLPKTTVFSTVAGLLERGVLIERVAAEAGSRGRGRPASQIVVNPSAGLYAGVDVGRARMHAVIVNASHEVVARGTRDLPFPARSSEVAPVAAELIRTAAADGGAALGSLASLGACFAGLPGIEVAAEEIDRVGRALEAEFGVPVLLGNNARAAALAEATWGAGRAVEDLVYVRWSTGIGGGFVVGGRAVGGAHGRAGEIGHVSVDPDGVRCLCGGRGCLERVAGGAELLAQCAAQGLELPGLDALVTAALDGAPVATAVVAAAARHVGRVIAHAAAQLDPSRIVVGGELARLGPLVLDPVRDAVGRLALPLAPHRAEVVPADLGDDAGALGAVAMLLRHDARPATTA